MRGAILCVYAGFPSLALSLKPLVGSVVSQQGADVFRAAPMEELEGDATCCVMP